MAFSAPSDSMAWPSFIDSPNPKPQTPTDGTVKAFLIPSEMTWPSVIECIDLPMLLGGGGGQPTSVCGIDSNPGRLVVASFAEEVGSGEGNVKSVVTCGDVEAGKQVRFDQFRA
jgi:hypothetical protein